MKGLRVRHRRSEEETLQEKDSRSGRDPPGEIGTKFDVRNDERNSTRLSAQLKTMAALLLFLCTAYALGISLRRRSVGNAYRSNNLSKWHQVPYESENRPFQNCNGTGKERRRLASMGDRSTAQDWRDMALCMVRRQDQLHSHLYLHISKCGGTSICHMLMMSHFKDRCFHGTECLVESMFGEIWPFMGWFRNESLHFKMLEQDWLTLNLDQPTDVGCSEMARMFHERKEKVAMLERWFPDEGACSDVFLTSTAIREPTDRILSHYTHLAKWCQNSDETMKCSDMFYRPDSGADDGDEAIRYFNVSLMTENFDIVTDNYSTRSFCGRDVFVSPFGMTSSRALVDRSLLVLSEIDWILLIGRNDAMEDENNHLLLRKGLGFSNATLPRHNKGKELPDAQQIYRGTLSFTDHDRHWLREQNKADYAIWDEAKRLHDLDVESIHKLELFASDILGYHDPSKYDKKTCCGNICD